MSEPLRISIEENALRLWLETVREGLEPSVPFNRDNNVMLASAYEERGKALQLLANQISSLLPLP